MRSWRKSGGSGVWRLRLGVAPHSVLQPLGQGRGWWSQKTARKARARLACGYQVPSLAPQKIPCNPPGVVSPLHR